MNHRLRIARMHSHYVVAGASAEPGKLQARMDGLARELAPACGSELEAGLDPDDDSVWFVRRLDVTVDADRFQPEELVRSWASQIARSVLATLAKGETAGCVRFENREDYIAHFVADLAGGRAWQQWYYLREFDGLRSLGTSAAIREALAREPARARGVALLLAARKQWHKIVVLLSERDAAEILRCCCAPASQSHRMPLPADAILSPLALSLAPAQAALILAAHSGFDVDAAAVLETAVQLPARSVRASSGQADERVFMSPRGCIFLLLPAIADTAPEEVLASGVLRLLLGAELLGCRESAGALSDPALLLAAGLEEPPASEETPSGPELDTLLQDARDAALRAFTARLVGFQRSSPAFLRQNFFEGISNIRVGSSFIEVELPPVPLRIVLRFAGVHGKSFRVPWLEDVDIRLRLPEE